MISDPLNQVLQRLLLNQRILCVVYIAAVPVYGAVAVFLQFRRDGAARGLSVSVTLAYRVTGASA